MDSRIKTFNQKLSLIAQHLGRGEQLLTNKSTSSRKELDRILDSVGELLIEIEEYTHSVGIYSKKKSIMQVQWRRYMKLVRRPTKEITDWVRSCLKLPVCIADGASLPNLEQTQPELVEFTLINRDGDILFQNALSQDHSAISPVWAELLAALEGKYVLSYDLALTQMQLAIIADYHHFDVPPLIGISLAPIYDLYFGVLPPKDAFMAGHKGEDMLSLFLKEAAHILPALPSKTTLDRAFSMLHVLNVITQNSYEVDGEQAEDDAGQFQGKEE